MHEDLAALDAVEQASLVRKRELRPIGLVDAAIALEDQSARLLVEEAGRL